MAKRHGRNRKQDSDETLVDLVEVSGQTQDFLERNQKTIFGVLTALVVIIGGIFVYRNFVQQPKEREAQSQIAQAQYQFERDSFAVALKNPGGGFPGFVDIIDQYGGTETADLAKYYAGISHLNLGSYQAAIDYLNDFDADGEILPIVKYGALGDAYSELNDFEEALDLYRQAAQEGEDVDILAAYYWKKYGMLSEVQGNFGDALDAYQTIKDQYSTTPDAQDIDKYIIRVQGRG